MKKVGLCLLACLLGWSAAAAQEPVSFRGKTVTMIIGFAAGGGTDAFGRLAASFLGTYLPGAPTIVVRNMPGADGVTAMNYLVQQVAPGRLHHHHGLEHDGRSAELPQAAIAFRRHHLPRRRRRRPRRRGFAHQQGG